MHKETTRFDSDFLNVLQTKTLDELNILMEEIASFREKRQQPLSDSELYQLSLVKKVCEQRIGALSFEPARVELFTLLGVEKFEKASEEWMQALERMQALNLEDLEKLKKCCLTVSNSAQAYYFSNRREVPSIQSYARDIYQRAEERIAIIQLEERKAIIQVENEKAIARLKELLQHRNGKMAYRTFVTRLTRLEYGKLMELHGLLSDQKYRDIFEQWIKTNIDKTDYKKVVQAVKYRIDSSPQEKKKNRQNLKNFDAQLREEKKLQQAPVSKDREKLIKENEAELQRYATTIQDFPKRIKNFSDSFYLVLKHQNLGNFLSFIEANKNLYKLSECLVDDKIFNKHLLLLKQAEPSAKDNNDFELMLLERDDCIKEKFKELVGVAMQGGNFSDQDLGAMKNLYKKVSDMIVQREQTPGQKNNIQELQRLKSVLHRFFSPHEKAVLKRELQLQKDKADSLVGKRNEVVKGFSDALNAYVKKPSQKREEALAKAASLLHELAQVLVNMPVYEKRLDLLKKESITNKELEECRSPVAPELSLSKKNGAKDFYAYHQELINEAVVGEEKLLGANVKKLSDSDVDKLIYIIKKNEIRATNYQLLKILFGKLMSFFVDTKQRVNELERFSLTIAVVIDPYMSMRKHKKAVTELDLRPVSFLQSGHTLFAPRACDKTDADQRREDVRNRA